MSAEDFFEGFDGEVWQGMKNAIAGEKAIGNEGVEVGVEVEGFAKGVDDKDDGGDGVGEIEGGVEVFSKAQACGVAEVFEQGAVALEISAQHFGKSQDVMAMGNRGEYAFYKKGSGGLDGLFLAGGAEAAAFAGEGEEEVVLAVVTMDSGKAALQVAAVIEFVDDLGDDWADWAHDGLVLLWVNIEEVVEVAIDT